MAELTLQEYQFHDMKLTWLRGADKLTDAGTLFGPVPKVVWSRYYPTNDANMMAELTDPILIQYKGKNYLIDASFDTAKLSDKQRRNLGILSESRVEESLALLGLSPEDIDIVLMTHMHHDHSGGLTYVNDQGKLVSKYPNAKIIVNDVEWYEMRNPNNRTRGTYLRENWEPIQDQVTTFSEYQCHSRNPNDSYKWSQQWPQYYLAQTGERYDDPYGGFDVITCSSKSSLGSSS